MTTMEELREKLCRAMWTECSKASFEECGLKLPPWENAPSAPRMEILAMVEAALRAIEEAGYAVAPKPKRQYYYKNNLCQASESSSQNCICWHDEGTGPMADGSAISWRTKPVLNLEEPRG